MVKSIYQVNSIIGLMYMIKEKKMDIKKLKELYIKRGFSDKKTAEAVTCVLKLEQYLTKLSSNLKDCSLSSIKQYIEILLSEGDIPVDTLLAIARYSYIINRTDIYIYFTKLLGGIGVLDNIKKRMTKYAGKETTDKVFSGFSYPPLGTPIASMPRYTEDLMNRIKESIPSNQYKKILAGNNHGIPQSSMQKEKEHYEKSESLEQYLIDKHKRSVNELQEYCDTKKVWFEQVITQPVVDYVKSNQELLSAVKKGNHLYVTKIPYDTVSYLKAESDKEKNYYACHCSFAREAIVTDEDNVNEDWCYCSAGFAKYPFEVILDRKLNVKVLKTALGGDGLCRFKISLEESKV